MKKKKNNKKNTHIKPLNILSKEEMDNIYGGSQFLNCRIGEDAPGSGGSGGCDGCRMGTGTCVGSGCSTNIAIPPCDPCRIKNFSCYQCMFKLGS